jgi:hypothetical protein
MSSPEMRIRTIVATLLRRNWGRGSETQESAAESPYFPARNGGAVALWLIRASLACSGAMGEIEPAQRFTVENSGAK